MTRDYCHEDQVKETFFDSLFCILYCLFVSCHYPFSRHYITHPYVIAGDDYLICADERYGWWFAALMSLFILYCEHFV